MVRPAGGRTSIGRRRQRSVARVFVLFCRDWVGREEQRVDERPLAPRGSPAAPASGFCARLCLSRRGAAPARRRRAFAWRCAHARGLPTQCFALVIYSFSSFLLSAYLTTPLYRTHWPPLALWPTRASRRCLQSGRSPLRSSCWTCMRRSWVRFMRTAAHRPR